MNTNMKLLGAVLGVALIAGCTGQALPGGTGGLGQPGFSGRITKGGIGQKDRQVWLKSFSGQEGSLATGSPVANTRVGTDSNGNFFIPAPPEAVSGGALFGIGYDVANTTQGGDENKKSAQANTDEIQWFSSPAYNLSTKTGKTVSVNFDVAWATQGFSPVNGNPVVATGGMIKFTLPPKDGATMYEVDINSGNVAGSGTNVAKLTSATPAMTWDKPVNGQHVYQAKVHLPSGVAGVTGNSQAASPWLSFTVTGAQ